MRVTVTWRCYSCKPIFELNKFGIILQLLLHGAQATVYLPLHRPIVGFLTTRWMSFRIKLFASTTYISAKLCCSMLWMLLPGSLQRVLYNPHHLTNRSCCLSPTGLHHSGRQCSSTVIEHFKIIHLPSFLLCMTQEFEQFPFAAMKSRQLNRDIVSSFQNSWVYSLPHLPLLMRFWL